tara:strand:- start:3754 stop:4998 length:1245 start_codon:yes stop_codon:yes gene_type:complete
MNIGIIGSGVAGLTLCYLLGNDGHKITLIEKNNRLGGHTNTYEIKSGEDSGLKIDTGFIVFNDKNYPYFINLLNDLEVIYENSDMSFSFWDVSSNKGYSGKNLFGLISDNFFDLQSYKLIANIIIYTKKFKYFYDHQMLNDDSLLEHFTKYKYPHDVVHKYFLPLASAIWSNSKSGIENWNANFFAKFYLNHGLLQFRNRPKWKYVVNGGSVYVNKIIDRIQPNIILNSKVNDLIIADSINVITNQNKYNFDVVFIATHADQATEILRNRFVDEYGILSAWNYSMNYIYLHKDTRLLPPKKRYWASWNYMDNNNDTDKISISYNMNLLNKLDTKNTYIVSLNPFLEPKKDEILYRTVYEHPVFDNNSLKTQDNLRKLNGKNNIFFAGSYFGNGFHEDAVRSAFQSYNDFKNIGN